MPVLGSGTHTIRILDRYTGAELAAPPLAKSGWSRRQNQWSTGTAQFTKTGSADCCGALANVRSWRHELEIRRDGAIVHIGPIYRIAENKTRVQIDSFDRLAWLNKRVLRGDVSLTDMDPTRVLGVVLGEALARYDPIPVRPAFTPTGGSASVAWSAASRTVAWSVLRDVLATHLDVTMVADILYAGAPAVPSTPVATLTPNHIAGDVDVVEDGEATATIIHTRGAGGAAYTWPPELSATPAGDDYYGVIDAVHDHATLSNADELADASKASWRYRRRPPVFVDLSSAARLLPTAPVAIGSLIPGAIVRLAYTTGRCRPVVGLYEITEVDVAQGSGSGPPRAAGGQFTTAADASAESVRVAFVPAGVPDA